MLFGLFGKRTRAPAAAAAADRPVEAILAEARALVQKRHFAAAEVYYEQARALRPGDALLCNEAGTVHYEGGDFDQAERAFREALAIAPTFPSALANLGQCLQARGGFAAARPLFEQALALDGSHRGARFNLSVACFALGQTERAAQLCRELIAESPDDPTPHIALGECLLGLERFEEGWREYEWRLAAPEYQAYFRHYDAPRWDGGPVDGACVLIWPEQGYGDTFQFMRLAFVAARAHAGMRFVLEVPAPMLRIAAGAARAFDNLAVVASGAPAPPFTHHVSIMSLPRLGACRLTQDPCPPPYLQPTPEEVAAWKPRVAAFARGRFTVGLVWAGNRRVQLDASEQAVDARRSIGAAALAPLLSVPGCAFFSLQVGARAAEMPARDDVLCDFTAELHDFAATAALIACLDLVISVDTSVAHLAGAMAAPVWMLSRHDCCWRWGARRAQIPWYPTLRPFYQPAPGDWPAVVGQVERALRETVAPRRP